MAWSAGRAGKETRKKRQKIQKRRWALQGRGHEMSGDPPTVVLEWRDRTQIEPTMNSKRKITAIDREHNKWKQNQSSGGAHMDHEVPKCLKYDVRCGALLPMTPCDSASLPNGRAASGQSFTALPTSTRLLHPILDPHDVRHCRLAQLAWTQAEAIKLAKQAEARDHLTRQTTSRRLLGKEQALCAGQQRLEEIVHTREQFAAELAARLRLATPKAWPHTSNVATTAIDAPSNARSAAAGVAVESPDDLDALTRGAEMMSQPDCFRERADEPCHRDTRVAPPAARGRPRVVAAARQHGHAGVLSAPLSTGWRVQTLPVTAADTVAETSVGCRAYSAAARGLHNRCLISALRHAPRGMVGKRYSSDVTGDGPSERTRRTLGRQHTQEHMRVLDEKGNVLTADEQLAYALSISDAAGGPSSATAPPPAPPPATTPLVPQISLIVTLSAHPGSRTLTSSVPLSTEAVAVDDVPDRPGAASVPSAIVDGTVTGSTTGDAAVRDAVAPTSQPPTSTPDSPEVQIVPAPPRPPITLIVLSDDHSDDDADGDVQVYEDAVTCDFSAYASDESAEVDTFDDVAPLNCSAPTKPRRKRKKWHDIADSQYAAENWHIAANRRFYAETESKRRRIGHTNDNGGSSTHTSMTRSARAPPTAILGPPQASDGNSIVVCGGESTDQLCSVPGCGRPLRMWRIDRNLNTAERICCTVCKVSPTDATAPSGDHSATCDASEAARSRTQPVGPPTPTPPPTPPVNATAATAPAPPAPPSVQVRAVRSDLTRTGRPFLPPLSPLISPHNSDDSLEHLQQCNLHRRQEREEITGIREEDYCWEDPNFDCGWVGPPRHCSTYQARREAKKRRLLVAADDHG